MSGLDEKGLEAARELASRLCIHSSDEERISIIAATVSAQEAEIERLRKVVERAKEVVEPFAGVASEWDGEHGSLHVFLEWNDDGKPVPSLPVEDFRAARQFAEDVK